MLGGGYFGQAYFGQGGSAYPILVSVAQATETDTARWITAKGIATEHDSALAMTRIKVCRLNCTSEIEHVNVIRYCMSAALSQSAEADAVFSITRHKQRNVKQATEIDVSRRAKRKKSWILTCKVEINAAHSFVVQKVRSVTSPSEIGSASNVRPRKSYHITRRTATEHDSVFAFAERRFWHLSGATEIEIAEAVVSRRTVRIVVSTATETSTILPAHVVKMKVLTTLHENEIVTKISVGRRLSVGVATTQDDAWMETTSVSNYFGSLYFGQNGFVCPVKTLTVRKSVRTTVAAENDLATRTRFQRRVDALGTFEAVLVSAQECAAILTSARLEQEGDGIISNPDATLTKVGL